MNSFADATGPRSAQLQISSQARRTVLGRGSGFVHAWRWLRAGLRRGVPAVRPAGGCDCQDVSWPLPSDPSSVRMARRLVRRQLADWGLDEQGEVAELLVSELVTNAVHHTAGPVALTLACQDGTWRCEVEDASTARPCMRGAREDDEGGRGLHLVEVLSRRWGCQDTPTGKIVWFELPAHAPPESNPK